MSDPTPHLRPDAIDRAAGLDPESPIYALRARQPAYLDGAEDCRIAVLTPDDDLGLAPALRAAIARRAALSSGNPRLIADYPEPAEAALRALATGGTPDDPCLAAIAAHADMIATDPGAAGPANLAALQAAGLSVPQIVALSELLAYVGFQVRVAHGLALLEATA